MSGVKGTRWGHLKPCPSWSAYKNHISSREVPCERCREFVNDARRARRAAERAEAEREVSARRSQERAVRQLVALLAEALVPGDLAPRCGRPMQRNERAGPVLSDPVCGRPAGHGGTCLSEAAWARKLAGNARWMARSRQERAA